MKEMKKSIARTSYLRKRIDSLLESEETERIVIECRKYKIPSAYAIEIIKYIYPNPRQTSYCPKVVIKWISDEYLIDEHLKEKNLSKIPEQERPKYEKYRVGREIKVRYRFKEQTKKYQEIKLAELYCLKLANYLKRNGY